MSREVALYLIKLIFISIFYIKPVRIGILYIKTTNEKASIVVVFYKVMFKYDKTRLQVLKIALKIISLYTKTLSTTS